MTRIEQAPIKMVEHLAIRSNGLHHAFEFRLHKVALDFLNARVDIRIQRIIAQASAQFLRRCQ